MGLFYVLMEADPRQGFGLGWALWESCGYSLIVYHWKFHLGGTDKSNESWWLVRLAVTVLAGKARWLAFCGWTVFMFCLFLGIIAGWSRCLSEYKQSSLVWCWCPIELFTCSEMCYGLRCECYRSALNYIKARPQCCQGSTDSHYSLLNWLFFQKISLELQVSKDGFKENFKDKKAVEVS